MPATDSTTITWRIQQIRKRMMKARGRRIGSRALRYASFASSALEANQRDLSLPYRLFVHVTNACNSRCNMCGIWRKSAENELETDELLNVLRHAGAHIKWMDLTGGEIFLRDDILEILRFVATEMPHLFMFHFATNGLLTERIVTGAALIARSAIPRFIVTVSLDGPPRLHDEILGVQGCWEHCVETFRRLRRIGVDVVFGLTLTEHNVDRYPETVASVAKKIPEISHKDFHVNLAQVSELYYGNKGHINPPTRRLLKSVEAISTLRGRGFGPVDYLEWSYLRHAHRYLETGKSPILCEALSSSAVLGPQGHLYPCIIYDRPVGTVREAGYSLATLWGTPLRAQVRAEIREGKCPHCWTPCEAYQSIIANSLPMGKNRRHPPVFLSERT